MPAWTSPAPPTSQAPQRPSSSSWVSPTCRWSSGDTRRAKGRGAASSEQPCWAGVRVGGSPPPSLLCDPEHLTLKSPLHQVLPCSLPQPLAHPGLGGPSAGQHLPGLGLGDGQWECPPWHQDTVPEAGRGWQGLPDHSSYGFGAEPKRGAEKEGGEGGWGGQAQSFCGSVCGKVFFFFFSFSPFFLSKKCMKARQPLCNGQQCFLGDGGGGEGTPPGPAPQLAPEGGLVLLKNVSQFKYQTKNRARRTTLAVAKSLPE